MYLKQLFFLIFLSLSTFAQELCLERGFLGEWVNGACLIKEESQLSSSCPKGQFVCNPLLFGEKVCVSDKSNEGACFSQLPTNYFNSLEEEEWSDEQYEFYQELEMECDPDFGSERVLKTCSLYAQFYQQNNQEEIIEDEPSSQIDSGGNISISLGEKADSLTSYAQEFVDFMEEGYQEVQLGESDFQRPEELNTVRVSAKTLKRQFSNGVWEIIRVPGSNKTFFKNKNFEYVFDIDEEIFPILEQEELESLRVQEGQLMLHDGIVEFPLNAELISQTDKLEKEERFLGCFSDLRDYLESSEFSDEKLQSFIKIQSELTLNKLAWSFLRNTNKKQTLESKIEELLVQKYQEQPEIAQEFDTLSLKSRKYLATAMPYVKDILNKQMGEDSLYHINLSDLHLLSLYSSDETKVKNYGFSTNHEDNKSLLHFTALVNSGFIHSQDRLSDKKIKDENTEFMFLQLEEVTAKLGSELQTILTEVCPITGAELCEAGIQEFEVSEFLEHYSQEIMKSLMESDKAKIKRLRYNDLWPKVHQ